MPKPISAMTDVEREQLLSDDNAMQQYVNELHAEKYPTGCGTAGHRCAGCHARLNEPMHTIKSHTVGARAGFYKGTVIAQCTECNWSDRW